MARIVTVLKPGDKPSDWVPAVVRDGRIVNQPAYELPTHMQPAAVPNQGALASNPAVPDPAPIPVRDYVSDFDLLTMSADPDDYLTTDNKMPEGSKLRSALGTAANNADDKKTENDSVKENTNLPATTSKKNKKRDVTAADLSDAEDGEESSKPQKKKKRIVLPDDAWENRQGDDANEGDDVDEGEDDEPESTTNKKPMRKGKQAATSTRETRATKRKAAPKPATAPSTRETRSMKSKPASNSAVATSARKTRTTKSKGTSKPAAAPKSTRATQGKPKTKAATKAKSKAQPTQLSPFKLAVGVYVLDTEAMAFKPSRWVDVQESDLRSLSALFRAAALAIKRPQSPSLAGKILIDSPVAANTSEREFSIGDSDSLRQFVRAKHDLHKAGGVVKNEDAVMNVVLCEKPVEHVIKQILVTKGWVTC